MIVVCTCGQKNRLRAELATGAIKAKEINCGRCKKSLAQEAAQQVDMNADIVLAILEFYKGIDHEDFNDSDVAIAKIFRKFALGIGGTEEPDDDEDEEEDDEEEDEDDAPKKRRPLKMPPTPKKKKSTKRTH